MKFDLFRQQFSSEEDCVAHLMKHRLEQGICCKNCEKITAHYWFKSVNKFQCKLCKSRTNLKSGTLFQDSNMPLLIWYEVLFLMTSTKKGYSAAEIQAQVGHKRYEPIWYMCQKIRAGMGERDDSYKLNDTIEIDDGFFVVTDDLNEQKEGKQLSRGRGSERQQVVMVMAQYKKNPEQTKKYRKKSALKYVKMKVMDSLEWNNIEPEIKANVAETSSCKTDAYSAYSKLNQIVAQHQSEVVKPQEADVKLPWVHTMIANAKRKMLGIHHSISRAYLQNYLNEFCYKINRRYFAQPLERVLIMAAEHKWDKRMVTDCG